MSIANISAYAANSGIPAVSTGKNNVTASGNVGNEAQVTAQKQASKAELETAVKNLNNFISPVAQSVEFSMDQDSGRVVVKVVDIETQKVLRQIPNEEVLAISKTLDKLQGLVIKQTA